MKKWKGLKSAHVKRLIGCTLALGLLAGTLKAAPLFAGAADKVDLTSACSLTVGSSSSTDKDFIEDIAKANVLMDIYLVADAVEKKGYEGYVFDVKDTYANTVTIPDNVDTKTWSDLAKVAAGVVENAYKAGNAIAPDKTIKAGETATNLSAGLYLVIARGDGITDYFEEKTDEQGNTGTYTVATTDVYKYFFAPEFVALPTKEPDENGEIKSSNPTPWLYTAQVFMKPLRELRYGDLKIVKDLLTFEDSEPAYFVFDVEATIGEGAEQKNVYSNVFTLEFTAAGEEYLLIEKQIPIGANVTVTEVYSGATYDLTSALTQNTVIVANDLVEVRFTNDYNENRKHYGAITNHFDPVLDENGNPVIGADGKTVYNWAKYADSREEGQQ